MTFTRYNTFCTLTLLWFLLGLRYMLIPSLNYCCELKHYIAFFVYPLGFLCLLSLSVSYKLKGNRCGKYKSTIADQIFFYLMLFAAGLSSLYKSIDYFGEFWFGSLAAFIGALLCFSIPLFSLKSKPLQGQEECESGKNLKSGKSHL